METKMNTYKLAIGWTGNRGDGLVISLRRAGYAAYRDNDTITTDAGRLSVLLTAGHGSALVI